MAPRLTAAVAVAAAAVAAVATRAAAQKNMLYINCGSSLIKSFEGHTWAADAGFDGGSPWVRTALDGSFIPALFHTSRYRPGGLTYTLQVPVASSYRLELVWAETFFTAPGRRFMDVFVRVDGERVETVVEALDVYGVAAGQGYKIVYPPVGETTYGMPVGSTVEVFVQKSAVGGVVTPEARGDPFLAGVGVVEDAEPMPTPTPSPTPGPTPDPNLGFAPPDPATISTALVATREVGAPEVPVRAAAAASQMTVEGATTRVQASRAMADTAYGVTTRTEEVRSAYATAEQAVEAMELAEAAFITTYNASFMPLAMAYNDATAFIASLSPDVCSFLTGVVKPFGFTDEETLAVNLAIVTAAANAAAAAAPTLTTQAQEVENLAAAATAALENFMAVVQADAQPSPMPQVAL